LTVTVPPTGTNGGTLYPGDWAFKIIKHSPKPTGINELNQSKILVSPNPSNSIFLLSNPNGLHEKAVIKVFDVSGRLVHEETVQDINGYQLDLKNNENGIYILKVSVNGQEHVMKLIKDKNQ
jgi:hypothetical protein